jgi:hypothetical protein
MGNQDVTVRITTPADTSGAKETTAELLNTAQAVKAVTDAQGAQTAAQQDTAQAAQANTVAQKEQAAALHDTAEAAAEATEAQKQQAEISANAEAIAVIQETEEAVRAVTEAQAEQAGVTQETEQVVRTTTEAQEEQGVVLKETERSVKSITSAQKEQATVLRDAERATTSAAQTTDEQRRATERNTATQARAASSMSLLASLLRGDLQGAYRAAQAAAHATGRATAVMLGPIGILIGALVTLGMAAKRGFDERRENRLKKDAEDAQVAMEAADEAAKKLGEQQLETLRVELARIRGDAEATVVALKQAIEDAGALADAEDQLNLARIESDPTLNPAEKISERAMIAERAVARRSAAAVQLAEGTANQARRVRDDTQLQESGAGSRLNRAVAASDRALSEQRNLPERQAAARNALRNEDRALREERTQISSSDPRRAEIDARIKEIGDALKTVNEDVAKQVNDRVRAATAELASAQEQFAAANEAAIQSANQLAAAERELARVRDQRSVLDSIEAQTRAVNRDRELGAAITPGMAPVATDILADTARSQDSIYLRINPNLKKLNDAVAKAAAAALEDGTSMEEADALAKALTEFATTLKSVRVNNSHVVKRLNEVEAQIRNLRTL